MIPVLVTTTDHKDGSVVEKLHDYSDGKTRQHLIKHLYWAMRHGVSVKIEPVKTMKGKANENVAN